jgi:ubiquinone/menaquinone biosynthesis C-methylase UbiE
MAFEELKQQADGLEIDYRVGDCENLTEIDDASYDIASSTVGVMFTPDHAATAGEIARVVKRGGRIGLANWTPRAASVACSR